MEIITKTVAWLRFGRHGPYVDCCDSVDWPQVEADTLEAWEALGQSAEEVLTQTIGEEFMGSVTRFMERYRRMHMRGRQNGLAGPVVINTPRGVHPTDEDIVRVYCKQEEQGE